MYQRMQANPKFQDLVARRSRFALDAGLYRSRRCSTVSSWSSPFNPTSLGQPLAEGSRWTVSVTAELLMFIFFWVLTAVYVQTRQHRFDALNQGNHQRSLEGQEMMRNLLTALALARLLGSDLRPMPSTNQKSGDQLARHHHVLHLRRMTMGITYWAASVPSRLPDFYTAGGITSSRTVWQLPATTCRPPRCSV